MEEKKNYKTHKKTLKPQIATKNLPRKSDFSPNSHTASAVSRLVFRYSFPINAHASVVLRVLIFSSFTHTASTFFS